MPKYFSVTIVASLFFCLIVGSWFLHSEIYAVESQSTDTVQFEVKAGESISALSTRLTQERVILHPWLFRAVLRWKHVDTNIKAGLYEVKRPITLDRVIASFSDTTASERTVTILPGWDVNDVARYLAEQQIATIMDVLDMVGAVGKTNVTTTLTVDLPLLTQKPAGAGLEGYLAPDTYRIYSNATLGDIVKKFLVERNAQFTDRMKGDTQKSGRTVHEILTMASILEKEVRSPEDKAKVADIFWRRIAKGWALQADSTVHYIVDGDGTVYTTAKDRQADSPWNTYKYKGLPPGPICNPSLESVQAALYPQKNDAWFFLTGSDGTVHYAKTLDEHNANRVKYLR